MSRRAECAGFNEASLDPGDYVAIEVEDFGHGIAPEVKDKIFEPFFTTRKSEGHRSWPRHGVWHCKTDRRLCFLFEHSRQGDGFYDPPCPIIFQTKP